MVSPADPTILRRLAFARYLYLQGVEQSKRPEPQSCMSLLSLHDATEFFLQLAAEASGVTMPKNVGFSNTGVVSKMLFHPCS
jgi:hypothetical protein